jgi:hypothetical protein
MGRKFQTARLLAAVLGLIFGVPGMTHASLALTTPAGLNPGDQFRFVFVTDGLRDATSANITDYDTFVNTQAGGATYNDVTISWQAIGSTSTVDAINHINGPTNDPVYLADGTLVATTTTTSAMGLWSGTLLHAINEDLIGNPPATNNVWTGTTGSGTAERFLGNPTTTFGLSGQTSSSWVEQDYLPQTDSFPLYGISTVLTVPGAQSVVPEPSTLGLGAFGAVAFLAYGWSRHRRAQRRQAAA